MGSGIFSELLQDCNFLICSAASAPKSTCKVEVSRFSQRNLKSSLHTRRPRSISSTLSLCL